VFLNRNRKAVMGDIGWGAPDMLFSGEEMAGGIPLRMSGAGTVKTAQGNSGKFKSGPSIAI
jgi:hypothetical protein